MDSPTRTFDKIILPPSTYAQERAKIEQRWPAAVKFIRERKLNEYFGTDNPSDVGIVLQGGLYNTVLRALERLGLADVFGESKIPLYVLNVTYPLVPEEFTAFAAGKQAILIIEEGQPEFIEQAASLFFRQADVQTRIVGKGPLPMAGEYTGAVVIAGIRKFLSEFGRLPVADVPLLPAAMLARNVPTRPSGLCTGCPERPLFASMKLLAREMGPMQVSADIGCHSFSTLPPFDLGGTIMGYGLGAASGASFNVPNPRRALSMMGDGGFWHNGLTSGIGNAVFNRHDGVTIIVDNGYAAATGGQYIPSSSAEIKGRRARNRIETAVRGVGVEWVRTIRTYDMKQTMGVLREALLTKFTGPKIVIAEGECQLNRQRRVAPAIKKMVGDGKRVVRERFGIDADVCTGDHSCIRLSGCPSLTIKTNPDPLRRDPVAYVDNSCVGCGVCGEVAHAAVLCPSFYRADVIVNPTGWDRLKARLRSAVISLLA
jgi:indolepyruvate ferredoxin oxidoreductase alpha subunit